MSETSPNSQPEGPRSPSITKLAFESGTWMWLRQLVTNGVSLVTAGILARHLTPAEFGLASLAGVIMKFLVILSRGGVGDFVIVDRDDGHEDRVHAAFWLTIVIGVVSSALIVAAIPLLCDLLDAPRLAWILPVYVLYFFLFEVALVPEALIRRSLVYRSFMTVETWTQVLASVAGAVMAIFGLGVWSLVLPLMVLAPIRTVAVFRLARFMPKWRLHRESWPRILRFSVNVIGQNFATTVSNESDTLVVGKVMGPHDLGIYNNAWTTAALLMNNTVGVVGSLALPSLAAVSTDLARLRAAFRRMVRMLSLLSLPAFVGMFVLAEEFVLTIYGEGWVEAVLPLRIFIIFAARRSIGSPTTVIYQVMNKTELGFKLSLIFIPMYLTSIAIGTHWGLVGIATAVTVSRTLWGFVQFKTIFDLIGETGRAMWGQVAPSFWSSLVMGGLVMLVKVALIRLFQPHPAILLFLVSGVGVVIYFVVVRIAFAAVRDDIVFAARHLNARIGRMAMWAMGQPKAPAA